MKYYDIIKKNIEENSEVDWWPRFAYHYTNITNAVSILEMGQIYSRSNAKVLGIMENDNASRQVIDMTDSDAKNAARFYFRPLTPTQYYNEGYKHPQLRYDDDSNANCPVPVFFAFDLLKFLSIPGCSFSETSRAGFAPTLYSGEEAFAQLNFQMIYKNGPMQDSAREKLYRQAELAQRSPMQIDTCLFAILCRNEFEQSMLLTLLKEKDNKLFEKYRPFIKVNKKDMFERNGLYIENCIFHQNKLSILFSNNYNKIKYTQRQKKDDLRLLNAKLEVDWYRQRSSRLERMHREFSTLEIDYEKPSPIFLLLPNIRNAKSLKIALYVENDLLGYKEFLLNEENSVF